MSGLRALLTAARARETSERGSTLIDLMIGVAIIGVVYVALAEVSVRVYMNDATMESSRELRQGGRIAISRFVSELRNAGQGLKTVTQSISRAKTKRVMFAGDIDNGSTAAPCSSESNNDGVEQITYRFRRAKLERRVKCLVGGRWQAEVPFGPMALDLLAGSFRYFDIDGVELLPGTNGLGAADRARVALVRMELVLEDPAGALAGEAAPRYQSSIDVLVRNNTDFLARLNGP